MSRGAARVAVTSIGHSQAHIIVYARVNDERSLRQQGRQERFLEIFRRMLA